MADQDLLVKISADTTNAVAGLTGLNSKVQESNQYLKLLAEAMEKAEHASKGAGEAAVQLNQAMELAEKAIEAVHMVFEKTIEAFIDADSAAQTLSNTFRLLGEKDVAAATEHMEEFAASIEATSTVSSETVVKLGTMATAIGLNRAQTEKLIKASADLSAVTGKDVKQTFDELLMTYKGVARGVSEYDKNTQSLSVSQLKNGEAVAMISDKYKGFAEAQSKTLAGQLAQVKNQFQHTLVDVGQAFSEFFKMGDQHLAIEALTKINDFLKNSVIPAVKSARESIDSFVEHIKTGWESISNKAEVLESALIAIGTAMAVAFGPAVIAWVAALTAQLLAAAAAMALALAQVLLVTAAVLALAAATEFVYKNFQLLKTISFDYLLVGLHKVADFIVSIPELFFKALDAVTAAIISLPEKIFDAFVAVYDAIVKLFSPANIMKVFSFGENIADSVVTAFQSAFSKIKTGFSAVKDSVKRSDEDLSKDIQANINKLDFGLAGKAVEGVGQFINGMVQPTQAVAKAQKDVADEAERAKKAILLSIEAQNALREAGKKITELQAKAAEISGYEPEIAKQKLALEMQNIEVLRKQLEDKGALKGAGEALIKQAKELAIANSKDEGEEKKRKALESMRVTTSGLLEKVNEYGKTNAEIIDLQTKLELQKLDLQEKELIRTGQITPELKAQLDMQRALTKEKAEQDKYGKLGKAGTEMKEGGEQAAAGITKAFGPVVGLTSGVGAAVGAAQAVVDAIPQMLDAVTHLITSITELPMVILNGIQKLFTAILQFLNNFIGNLSKAIDGIIKAIFSFVEKLPGAIVKFVQEIPKLIINLLNKLPDIITKFIYAIQDALPGLIEALITNFIKTFPKIVLTIAYLMAVEIPQILWRSLVNLLKNLGKIISDIFSGKAFHFDPKTVKDGLQNMAQEISKSSSKLFSVVDLGNAAKDANKFTADVEQAGKDVINKIMAAFKWIWDNILKPIGDLVMKAFKWVWDNVLYPIVSLVAKAFQWVWDNILYPIVSLVAKAFQWVWDNIFYPIVKLVTDVFQWVWDKIFAPIVGLVQAAFQWVIDKVLSPIFGLVTKAFQWVLDFVFNVLPNLVIKAFQWVIDKILTPMADVVKKAFQFVADIFTGAVKIAEDIGKAIWKPLADGFASLGDIFSDLGKKIVDGMGLGGGGGGGGGGIVGTVKGWFKGHAEGGYISGAAAVAGNSAQNDTVLSLLSPGEAVISRQMLANKQIKKIIDAILASHGNFDFEKFLQGELGAAMAPQRFADGGIVGVVPMGNLGGSKAISNARSMGMSQNVTNNINLNMTIANSGAPIDTNWVKSNVFPTIKDELKKATLRGDLIVSKKGVY